MNMIHEKGFKGERDRAKCAENYAGLCAYFHVKRLPDSEIARLSNQQFYKLCEDIFNSQSMRAKRLYAEKAYGKYAPQYRRHPLAFKWFYFDLMRLKGGFLTALTSPFRYVRFRWNMAHPKAEKTDVQKVAKAMSEATPDEVDEIMKANAKKPEAKE